MELKVTLEFACSGCAQKFHVTLECTGEGLQTGNCRRVKVHVPCPYCGSVSCVEFEPGGAIHAVTPAGPRRTAIEPSIN
jgi:hypothetical protein